MKRKYRSTDRYGEISLKSAGRECGDNELFVRDYMCLDETI